MMQDITQLPWMYREDDDLFEVYPSDEAMGGPANEGAVWAPICREIYKEEDAALIVRACNNHRALLEIAKEVQSAIGRLAEQGQAGQAFNALLLKINAAIANAEKE